MAKAASARRYSRHKPVQRYRLIIESLDHGKSFAIIYVLVTSEMIKNLLAEHGQQIVARVLAPAVIAQLPQCHLAQTKSIV